MNSDQEKLKKIAKRLGLTAKQIPRNIAIIMDGNGRWAQQRDLPRVEGLFQYGKLEETQR